jgi:non-ribosomal peptide synthetase component E (peptide arylation enzyme)
LRTHNDSIAGLKWDAIFHEWGENLLLFFPLGHTTGYFVGLDLQVYLGRQITLMTGKFGAESVFSLIQKEKVTAVYLPTPLLFTIAEALEQRPQLALEYNLKSLKKFTFGGAQAPPNVIRTVIERTGRPVLQTWGMAEGAMTSSLIRDPPYAQVYTVGKIQCPDLEMRVIDEDGKDVPVGTPGELIYKGPFLFAGYYKDPDLTKKSIDEDGYFHTGDQIVLDSSGNMKIVGRLKDLIRRGGEPISAAELEELIQRHEKVAEVAVVAMPDKRMIEKVCAYIVPKPNTSITLDEIITFLKAKEIATFKLPERIELIDRLPRGEQKGNVLKKQLREDITNKLKAEGKI